LVIEKGRIAPEMTKWRKLAKALMIRLSLVEMGSICNCHSHMCHHHMNRVLSRVESMVDCKQGITGGDCKHPAKTT